MNFFCNNYDAIYFLLISGIFGSLGQALCIGVGLYKLYLNKNPLVPIADLSNPDCKLGGVFVGWFVGIILTIITKTEYHSFMLVHIISLITAGYVVTYLIENRKNILAHKRNFTPNTFIKVYSSLSEPI